LIARLAGENSKLSQEVEKFAAKLSEGIHYLYRAPFCIARLMFPPLPFAASDLSVAETARHTRDTERQLAALRETRNTEVNGLRERLAELSQRQGLGESDDDNEVPCYNLNAPPERPIYLS
jgi:hypothetical protein